MDSNINMSDTTQNSYLSQLRKTIQARKNLRNIIQANQLMNLGLYEQAAKIQEPITKTIIETSEETKKELEKVRNAIQPQSQPLAIDQQPTVMTPEDIEILNIIKNETETSSRLSNNTLSYIKTVNNVNAFTIGSGKNRELFGLKNMTLVNINSAEEYVIPSVGVAKLLFQSKPTENDITKEDVEEYKRFLDRYKLNITQNSKRKIIHAKTKASSSEANTANGEGVITIPSDADKLREALILQLADVKAGNNNNFNHANAIMKEMLSQKLITLKEYRSILKNCFRV
jgi:uncharacterized protein (UPF0254 family)